MVGRARAHRMIELNDSIQTIAAVPILYIQSCRRGPCRGLRQQNVSGRGHLHGSNDCYSVASYIRVRVFLKYFFVQVRLP